MNMSRVFSIFTRQICLIFFLLTESLAFRYKCFLGFCDTKLNEFCNYRLDSQSCEVCTPSVCAWENVPDFCAEDYCPGLLTTPGSPDAPQDYNSQGVSMGTYLGTTIPLSVLSIILAILLANRCVTLRTERSRGKTEKECEEVLLSPQPDVVVPTPSKRRDEKDDKETRKSEPNSPDRAKRPKRNPIEGYINNDTNEGRDGFSEIVVDGAATPPKILPDSEPNSPDRVKGSERNPIEGFINNDTNEGRDGFSEIGVDGASAPPKILPDSEPNSADKAKRPERNSIVVGDASTPTGKFPVQESHYTRRDHTESKLLAGPPHDSGIESISL